MVTVLWIIAAIICVALCAYGITTAIRRSKDRREQDGHAPTRR
jgi:beta-lactamase regulating signal transducer with metallopeptidase domain